MKELYLGDCLEVLATLPENSVDTVITDPPYHLRLGTAVLEGRDFIGVELEPEYYEIAERRIAHAELQPRLED